MDLATNEFIFAVFAVLIFAVLGLIWLTQPGGDR